MSFPWLLIIGGIPLIGAMAVALVPAGRDEMAKVLGLGVSLVALAFTIGMGLDFDPGAGSGGGMHFQFAHSYPWIDSFGAHFAYGVDGVGLVLVSLTTVLLPVVLLASWRECGEGVRSVKTYVALVLVAEFMLVGAFAATDVFLFYVFFEAMLVPMYFLIGSYGGPRRAYASMKFLLYSLFGGLLMLAAVIGLYVVSADQLGHGTFDFSTLTTQLDLPRWIQVALFAGFFIAFAIKAPLFPFHTWLPDAGAEAPTGVAVLLVGVMDKVGTFGFIRYCITLFPDGARVWAPYIIALSVVGIFYGALLAMGQKDLKRLVCYTSIAHFGFITLGIFALTSQGQAGGVFYMLNHGLSTGALFLVVGFLVARRQSRLAADYNGVSKAAPILAGAFLLTGMSSLALPGLSTFVSEFLVLVGTFTRYRTAAVIATVGIVLAALYILLVYQRTMTGPLSRANEGMRDLDTREAFVIAPVLVLIVVLGIYPKPVLDVITPAVTATVHQAGRSDPAPTDPAPAGTGTQAANGGVR